MNSLIPLCKWNMSMIPASDRKIKGTLVIAYCLSYNILKAQRDKTTEILLAKDECRIQFWEKVMSHREYTQNVKIDMPPLIAKIRHDAFVMHL